jgi:deoxyribodipyrimidine photo-lyase
MIQPERVKRLNDGWPRESNFVLYWMQASQRAEWNHALEYAIREANRLGLPVVALFGLTDTYPEANLRHYAFMLEGLKETQAALRQRGIQLVARHQSPEEAAVAMAEEAALLVTDRGYTRIQKQWRQHVARHAPCPVVQVESDVIIPVETASDKEEYAAATIRPKLHRQLDAFLQPMAETPVKRDSLGLRLDGFDLSNVDATLAGLDVDRSVPRQGHYLGGTAQAKKWLDRFIADKLNAYADNRGDPSLGIESHLSPYLHFGQVSPLYIALRVLDARDKRQEAKDAFLEELIVRRELSMNFVHYSPHYNNFRCLPAWARATLAKHAKDKREYTYSRKQLEACRTHDPYWNAAMREMVVTGKMHNYMRMYWGKKILEWNRSPEAAFRTALALNNKWFLDGRDPNSYAGVAWCFGKHDRPWGERPIFGTVRYMNAAGLRRKFDMETYVRQMERLAPGG